MCATPPSRNALTVEARQILRLPHHEGEKERECAARRRLRAGEVGAEAPLHGRMRDRHRRERSCRGADPLDLRRALEREARLDGQVEGRARRSARLRQPQDAAEAHALAELRDNGRILVARDRDRQASPREAETDRPPRADSTASRVRRSEPLDVHGASSRPVASRTTPSAAGSAARAAMRLARGPPQLSARPGAGIAPGRSRTRGSPTSVRPASARTPLPGFAKARPAAAARISAVPRKRPGGTSKTHGREDAGRHRPRQGKRRRSGVPGPGGAHAALLSDFPPREQGDRLDVVGLGKEVEERQPIDRVVLLQDREIARERGRIARDHEELPRREPQDPLAHLGREPRARGIGEEDGERKRRFLRRKKRREERLRRGSHGARARQARGGPGKKILRK